MTHYGDAMATPRITFYLDTVSPFAYIAYYVLRVSTGASGQDQYPKSHMCPFYWVG